jgi:COP9 signalosome complex subunit 4
MEHNLLASSKIYNNITFRGLGALLDLTPGAAETMARKMIEQGRLRGSIDQVDKLIWFDGGREDDGAQGKAGGLGDVEQETEDTGAPFTKRWDMQIRLTAANVSQLTCVDTQILITSTGGVDRPTLN